MGYDGFTGDGLIDAGFSLGAEVRLPFGDIPINALHVLPMSDNLHAFVGLARTSYGTVDDLHFSNIIGWTLRLGAGGDLWLDDAMNIADTEWCVGFGGQLYGSFTMISADKVSHPPEYAGITAGLDDSAWSIGVGGEFGPRLRQANGPFGVELNGFAGVQLTEIDFGVRGSTSGRINYGANIAGTFNF